jgi:hypothetical protein
MEEKKEIRKRIEETMSRRANDPKNLRQRDELRRLR